MPYALYLMISVGRMVLYALELAMLLRALLSWLPFAEGGFLETLLYALTEPLIHPLRVLFDKTGWFAGMPLDMPFFFTAMLLILLNTLL